MKINRFSELSIVIGLVLLSLATAMMNVSDLGVSMVLAPAFVLADKVGFISSGMMTNILQCFVAAAACVFVLRKFRLSYLFIFISSLIFGLLVDIFIFLLSWINDPALWQRILLFACAVPINALSIAFVLRSYFPPAAPEFLIKAIAQRYSKKLHHVKHCYDLASCAAAIALSLLFFRELRYVGAGTIVYALINAPLIGFFGRILDKYIDFSARFPKLEEIFSK